jgi:hypothetical protein
MSLRIWADDTLAEATGRRRRRDPVRPVTGGVIDPPAGMWPAMRDSRGASPRACPPAYPICPHWTVTTRRPTTPPSSRRPRGGRDRDDQTVRVLTALVDNAIQHTPAGGTVAVTVRPVGHEVRLRVNDIADRYGGRLEADSRPGHGATCTLMLPRVAK